MLSWVGVDIHTFPIVILYGMPYVLISVMLHVHLKVKTGCKVVGALMEQAC